MSESPDCRPTFSVIVPVYNHAAYVADAIRSILTQTRSDWQCIIVDDGSTDGSAEIIDEFVERHGQTADGRQQLVAIHQANAGPAAARNAAIELAAGQWLTYLDSDDVWFPQTLERYGAYVEAHPQAEFVYGYRHRLNPDGSTTELPGEHQHRRTGTAELLARMFLSHLCVCYRRELLDKAGRYDAALRSCEDYELYLRLSLHCRFEPLGAATGLRRRHETNISRQTGASRMLEAEVLRRFVERQGGRRVLDDGAIRRRLGRLYYAAARQYFKARRFRECLIAGRYAAGHRGSFKLHAVRCLARLLLPLGARSQEEIPKL